MDIHLDQRQRRGFRSRIAITTTSSLSLLALSAVWHASNAQQTPTVPATGTGPAAPAAAPPAPSVLQAPVQPTSPQQAPAATNPPPSASAPGTQPRQVDLRPVDVTAPQQKQQKRAQPRVAQPVPAQAPVAQPQTAAAPPPPQTPPAPSIPMQTAPGVPAASVGQTVSTVGQDRTTETRAFSVGDVLQDVPGISVKQGNGPRDFGVSIRGSNARNGFAVRNVKVYEDGFPVTQPDGLSRTDLTDPHAYGGIDVWRGPSSVLFGNYATGGAINFRTRPGGEINGIEFGVDVGSFGYLNNYMTLGGKSSGFEYMLFASDVRGNGHLDWNGFDTQTVNFLGVWTPTSQDKVTVKVIHNHLDTDLSIRLSLAQFNQNPFQKGCQTAATAALGCGTVSLFTNGFNGAKVNNTAAQAGLSRDDTRTIVGTRWEHKFDDATKWQIQYVVDDRNIHQPTGATSADGDFLSHNISTNLQQTYDFFGMKARHLVGAFYNYLPNDSDTFNVMPGGNARIGAKTQNVLGYTSNAGAQVREEISPNRHWLLAFGTGVETTMIHGVSTAFNYAGPVGIPTSTTSVFGERHFTNHAYEASVAFRPDDHWQWRARVGTGYGTPQIGNLFVTPGGVAGNNTQLESQQNIGYDAGFDWTPAKWFKLSTTGYYEFFRNELVSQSAGAGLQSFTFNAPASEHRGVEVAAEWKPFEGWRAVLAYGFTDQIYTEYAERLSAGAKTALIDRAGNKIPGVSPHELLARVGYDLPSGPLKGLGAYVEYQWKDAFYMDNGNLLQASGYELVNLNLHYAMNPAPFNVSSMNAYFEIRNLFDKTYISAANNISNSLNAGTGLENGASTLMNSTGSIYAGTPRVFYGGLKVKF